MNNVNLPWIIVIGYAAGGTALWARGKMSEAGAPGVRAMTALAVFFFAITTVFWFSLGFTRWGLVYGAAAAAALGTAIVLLRKRRLGMPLRMSAKRHASAEPTFGVFPAARRTWPLHGPGPQRPPRFAEFEHQSHRLLGYEYAVADGTFTMTELRIPPGPTLLISPRSFMNGAIMHGSPTRDTRIGRTAFGTPKPADVQPIPVDPEFDKWYEVSTNEPGFAAAVLTPEIRTLLRTEPALVDRAFGFDQDALWTVDSGRMSPARIIGSGRSLALFAAAVTPAVWRGTAFGAMATGTQTAVEAWRGTGGGSVLSSVNTRRELASRKPITGGSLVFRSVVALALLVGCGMPAINLAAALTGQTDTVPLTVTKARTYVKSCARTDLLCSRTEYRKLTGTYQAGGAQRQLELVNPPGNPEVGDTIPLNVGPMWWHPVFSHDIEGWVTTSFAAPGLLLGAWLAQATYLPRRPRRARKDQAEQIQVAPPLH
ncbi:hypothetical protein [Amycolatopsis benzoatilytica]|uniref:hypothetical protein n=1 Tax=Amycolatopsis benzoatilytica TaxID=346045 RepID=UPI0003665B64|nr:hypothetical protein [Amycolatopsis benzoatilytica]